jgi:hypothetical protein
MLQYEFVGRLLINVNAHSGLLLSRFPICDSSGRVL